MLAIICILLVGIISAMLLYAEPMLNGMFDVVFDVAGQIQGVGWDKIVNDISNTIYSVAIYLMIIKFLVKMFNTYVLWSDGEDVDPIQMVTNFIKAVVIAFSFPYIYRYFINIARKVIDAMTASITDSTGEVFNKFFDSLIQSMGFGPLVLGLVFVVGIIVMYFSFMKRGIELEMMILGVPLACTGLLDNDKGVFKSYMNQMVKLIITTMFQIVLMRLGLALGLNAGAFDGTGWNMLYGIACIFLSLKVPQILSEWMIPSGGNGGGMQKLYAVSMVSRAVKGLVK